MCIVIGNVEMNKERILKHLRGLSSSSEKEELLNWVDQSEENAAFFNSIRSDFLFENLPYKIIDKQNHSGIICWVNGTIPV